MRPTAWKITFQNLTTGYVNSWLTEDKEEVEEWMSLSFPDCSVRALALYASVGNLAGQADQNTNKGGAQDGEQKGNRNAPAGEDYQPPQQFRWPPWQPIETVPPEGEQLLALLTDEGFILRVLYRDEKGRWILEGEPTFCHTFYVEPKYWIESPPLPEIP